MIPKDLKVGLTSTETVGADQLTGPYPFSLLLCISYKPCAPFRSIRCSPNAKIARKITASLLVDNTYETGGEWYQ